MKNELNISFTSKTINKKKQKNRMTNRKQSIFDLCL